MKNLILISISFILLILAGCESEEEILFVSVKTKGISNISHNFAIACGQIEGTEEISNISKGFCWSKFSSPTIDDYSTQILIKDDFQGEFFAGLENLIPSTKYYVKAFIKDKSGNVIYGNQISFSTSDLYIPLPGVSIMAIEGITSNSALIKVGIANFGGTISSKGVCWSINPEPDIDGNFARVGSGDDYFNYTITDLKSDTYYYVRAYAINEAGINYSAQKAFQTEE